MDNFNFLQNPADDIRESVTTCSLAQPMVAVDALSREMDDFLANVWAAARLHKMQLRLRGIQTDARTHWLLSEPLTMIDDNCPVLFAVMLLQKFGTELQLFAQPDRAKNRQTSCCHISRVVRFHTQPGGLPDIRDTIKNFVQDICKDTEFDELCWGSELPESTVQAVLNGTHTNLRDVSNVVRAAGFHLHLVLVHEETQVVIGDKRFQSEFADLYVESRHKLDQAKLLRGEGREHDLQSTGTDLIGNCLSAVRLTVRAMHHSFGKMQPNSWNLLLGDLQ